MTLADIENKHSFKYPKLYKQLEQDGMLDVGEYSQSWKQTVYPQLKDNPPLLLHSCDFELIPLSDLDEEISELRNTSDY